MVASQSALANRIVEILPDLFRRFDATPQSAFATKSCKKVDSLTRVLECPGHLLVFWPVKSAADNAFAVRKCVADNNNVVVQTRFTKVVNLTVFDHLQVIEICRT